MYIEEYLGKTASKVVCFVDWKHLELELKLSFYVSILLKSSSTSFAALDTC